MLPNVAIVPESENLRINTDQKSQNCFRYGNCKKFYSSLLTIGSSIRFRMSYLLCLMNMGLIARIYGG